MLRRPYRHARTVGYVEQKIKIIQRERVVLDKGGTLLFYSYSVSIAFKLLAIHIRMLRVLFVVRDFSLFTQMDDKTCI